MKSSLKKLRNFALNKNVSMEKKPANALQEPPEMTNGMQDVKDMWTQYEGLVDIAHTISSSAYDFSRSVQEMATYMVEIFGEIGDEGIGTIFNMLGKVEYEISKLLDLYVAHVSHTIIKPTEILLNELQHVLDMKKQYDEKRLVFSQLQAQRPKGKMRKQKLLSAEEEFEDLEMDLGLRLQSMKQGRPLSLVTQAARYHNAQRNLFSKGLASLNALEPVMMQLTQELNIDRTMSEGDIGVLVNEDGIETDGDVIENDDESESFTASPRFLQPNEIQNGADKPIGQALRMSEVNSKSAPISSSMYNQIDNISKIQESMLGRPVRKTLTTYALPSPSSTRERWNSQTTSLVPESHRISQVLLSQTVPAKVAPNPQDSLVVLPAGKGAYSPSNSPYKVKESLDLVNPSAETNLQVPMISKDFTQTEVQSNGRLRTFPQPAQSGALDTLPSLTKRYSHSGPITAKQWVSHKQVSSDSSSLPPGLSYRIDPLYKSGPVRRSPISRAFISTRISPSISPPILSPPSISELHKLPPPPAGSGTQPPKSTNFTAPSKSAGEQYSEPFLKSGQTSLLPPPLLGSVTRSLSGSSLAEYHGKLQQAKGTDLQGSQVLKGWPHPSTTLNQPDESRVGDKLQISKKIAKV